MLQFQTTKKVRTRKEHHCCICLRKIPRGFHAINANGMSDGEFFNEYICNTCYELQAEFPESVCDFWEGYWDSDTFFESLSEFDCETPLQLLTALRKQKKEKKQC